MQTGVRVRLDFLRSCAICSSSTQDPAIGVSQIRNHTQTSSRDAHRQRSQSEEQQFAKKQILKMVFKKVQEGCKIRLTYGIFGYTRRDKLFIFVGVGVFHPLSRRIVSTTHAPLRKNNCQYPKPNGASEKIPAAYPPNVRLARRPGCPSDDSGSGDSPPAESNGRRLPSGRRHHTPGGGCGHELPHPRT